MTRGEAMDKKEIISRLNKIASNAVHMPGETPFCMSLDDGIAIHEAIEAVEREQRWIPAKTTADGWTILDNRIDRKRSILVTYKTNTGRRYVKQVEVGTYGSCGYVGKQLNGRIIAWMPLPSPYQEES